jgi:uncharacterized protein (DUF433 family)
MGIDQHINVAPERCGGKPCIRNTRVRVWDIYMASEIEGKTPDEVVAAYPQLSLADVHAALAYYWDHRSEIEAEMDDADGRVAELKAKTGPGPLSQRFTATNARP